MTEFHMIVEPVGPGTYRAMLGGQVIVKSSTQPFLDGARVLAANGADASDIVTMRHKGAADWSLRSQIGTAAALSVVDRTGKGGAGFAPYKAFPADKLKRSANNSEK